MATNTVAVYSNDVKLPKFERKEREVVSVGGLKSVSAVEDTKQAAIEVGALSAYFGNKQVLKNLQVDIKEREITAIIGPSGCGKTTFLRTINRMSHTIPGFHHQGKVAVLGQDISQIRDVESFRRSVGMLFQRPNPFPMSILDNLTLALKLFGVGKKERVEIAKSKLDEVGLYEDLQDRLHQSPFALSGGQQQRLCLARALAVNPQILLLDEPASALDPKSTRLLEDLFMRLSEQMTIVIVTHNLAQAKRIATRTAFMEAGEIVEFESTQQLFYAPADPRTRVYVEEQIG